MSEFKPGLEGVVAVETEIAEPDREGGVLRYRGIDIEGHADDKQVAKALEALKKRASLFRVLGSYPRWVAEE